MAIVLNRLVATGPNQADAEIVFHTTKCLIRGPSDTGKSYIRDCLWYLLGGDKVPKQLPEAEGYDSLVLEFASGNDIYHVQRGIKGGATALFKISNGTEATVRDQLDIDVGELLVELSGAGGRKILRSTSEKGAVTGGDLRHWFLLSQPGLISENPTYGESFDKTQRIASFNLFLTGNDDAAIELRKSTAEVERIKGQLSSAEDAYKRVQVGLPSNITRKDVEGAFKLVDETLTALNNQYQFRATALRELRAEISGVTNKLRIAQAAHDHSASMVGRFELLDAKYASDLERLGATDEGIGFFEALPETPCPLCGTPVEQQLDPAQLRSSTPAKYRQAIAAEAGKISVLRRGLKVSLDHELTRLKVAEIAVTQLKSQLAASEEREAKQITGIRVEFSADPKTLAVRHSELSAQLGIFDEMERLSAEIERLKKAKVRKRVEVVRDGGNSLREVEAYAKTLLNDWGFDDVTSVQLDALECDLVVNGRPRLSFGAGRRALFLAALSVALLRHALEKGNPHLGVVVIDSPLKAYADPKQTEAPEVPVSTVTEKFYSWLSDWNGPGQVVILENEDIRNDMVAALQPIQFTGAYLNGRPGFYPIMLPYSKT